MVCPDCGKDSLVVHTEFDFMGYEEGDRVDCTTPFCFYSKYYKAKH